MASRIESSTTRITHTNYIFNQPSFESSAAVYAHVNATTTTTTTEHTVSPRAHTLARARINARTHSHRQWTIQQPFDAFERTTNPPTAIAIGRRFDRPTDDERPLARRARARATSYLSTVAHCRGDASTHAHRRRHRGFLNPT
jgi:hypothetical protein